MGVTSSPFRNLSTQLRSYCHISVTTFEKSVRTRCQSGNLTVTEALGYSKCMLEMETMPSIWTLNLFFGSLSKLNQFSTVVSMYTHLKRSRPVDFYPGLSTLNVVVKCLCRSGNVKSGFSVLGTMVKSGIRYDFHTLNTLLDGLFREGSMAAAMEFFVGIRTGLGSCSEVTYGIVINGFCKAREPQKALELLQEMLDGGRTKPHAHCFSAVVDCLVKAGLIHEATTLFHKMIDCGIPPNAVTYNSLILGCSVLGNWGAVARILENMKAHRVTPDIVTFNTILDARFKEGSIMEALHLVRVMAEKHALPDALTWSSFLDSLSCNSRSGEARILCDSMEDAGVVADTHTLTILLNGLTTGFMMLEAQKLFEVMIEKGQANTITFTTMINGYCLHGEMDKAVEMLDQMERYNVLPNVVTYGILAKGYLRVERVDEALRILKEMVLRGLRPNYLVRSVVKTICSYGRGSVRQLSTG